MLFEVNNNMKLHYKPELDGLRGIAMIIIVLFHIYPQYFSFGYIGVEILFVLSGFLITYDIYNKLSSNDFHFFKYIKKRLLRIVPSLIIVLIVALVIGYLFLFPLEFKQLASNVKSSALFKQNFRLSKEGGYWSGAGQLNPLLHLWYLSVLVQLYIIWPIILKIIQLFKIKLNYSLFFIFTISLLSLFFIKIDLFYHSFARLWEFAFGGFCCSLYINNECKINDKIYKFRSFIIILFLLSIGLAFKTVQTHNLYRIIPNVIFSGLLIILLLNQNENKIFSFKGLVYIGKISYPLYLWHYVLFSFLCIFVIGTGVYGIVIIILSILLSWFTYNYIESYFIKNDSFGNVLVLIISLIVIIITGYFIDKKNGLPNRKHLSKEIRYFEEQSVAKLYRKKLWQNAQGIQLITKVLGYKPINPYIKSTSSDITKNFVLITGDSHAFSAYTGLAEEIKKNGYEAILVAHPSYPPYIDGYMGKNLQECDEFIGMISSIYDLINKLHRINKLEAVIFITRGPKYMYDIGFGSIDDGIINIGYKFKDYFNNKKNYNQKEKFFEVVLKTFKYFENGKIKVYYLLENPELGFLPWNCVQRPYGIFKPKCKIKYDEYLKRMGEYRIGILKISKKFKYVTVLDPEELFCDKEYCYAVRQGKVMYADDDHLSMDGSKVLAEYLVNKMHKASLVQQKF